MIPIATSRFNNETWDENCSYRSKINASNGCIYGCPRRISTKIADDHNIFVVEMNNSTNQIEGIGLIKNTIRADKYYNIYKCHNYNRYVYKGDYHIDRDILEKFNVDLVECLDYILFKEKTHMKRGSGIKLIPEKLLKHEMCRSMVICDEIRKIFRQHFKCTEKKEPITGLDEQMDNNLNESHHFDGYF